MEDVNLFFCFLKKEEKKDVDFSSELKGTC